jgi:hypothetical protein
MALKQAGVGARLKLYRDKTHTQPVVEDPMRGGRDELMDDVLSLVSHLVTNGKRVVSHRVGQLGCGWQNQRRSGMLPLGRSTW